MAAKVRGQKKTLYASGECVPRAGKIRCGVECDGGGVDLQRDAKTGGIVISFDRLNDRIRMTVGCDADEEDSTFDLTAGADDKLFRLSRADLSVCRSLNRQM
jgi:hypothetical protein